MEKWMIVYVLPLEVWMDIFCFPCISRANFGQIVDRIGNFKFAEHAQFFLHEWGKHSLGYLHFDKDRFCKYVDCGDGFKPYHLEVPQIPLPVNIKSFQFIGIKHFDAKTLGLLDKIGPLLIPNHLEIALCNITNYCLENFRTILTNLAPLLDGVQSFYCGDSNDYDSVFPIVKEQLFRDNEKLAKLKMLEINLKTSRIQEHVDFIMNWLAQPDNDGPRLFEVRTDNAFAEQMFRAIREQFHAAKTPRTFTVNLVHLRGNPKAGIHLVNGIGEELHGEWKEWAGGAFQIIRHRAGCNTREVHEWIDGMTKNRDYNSIWMENPTIGSFDAAQMDVPLVDEEPIPKEQQQPCSSKDS